MAQRQDNTSPTDAKQINQPTSTYADIQSLSAGAFLELLAVQIGLVGELSDPNAFPEPPAHKGRKTKLEQDYLRLRKQYGLAVQHAQALIALCHLARNSMDTTETTIRRKTHEAEQFKRALDEVPVTVIVLGQIGTLLDTRPDGVDNTVTVQQSLVTAYYPHVHVQVDVQRRTATVTTTVGKPVAFSFDNQGFFSYEELSRLVGHLYVSGIEVRQECILRVLKAEYVRAMRGDSDEEQVLLIEFGDKGLTRIKQLGASAVMHSGATLDTSNSPAGSHVASTKGHPDLNLLRDHLTDGGAYMSFVFTDDAHSNENRSQR